jgi:two-component system chemotaxis sensor kinase CheA
VKVFKNSMKTKILIILLIIPTIILGIYYTIGANLFEEDKIAYIYSHSQEETTKITKDMNAYFEDLSNFFNVLINANDYPLEYFEFFSNKYNLEGISFVDITAVKPEVLITYGEKHRPLNYKSFKPNQIKIVPNLERKNAFTYGQVKEFSGKKYFLSLSLNWPSFLNLITESSFSTILFDSRGRAITQSNKEQESSTFSNQDLDSLFKLSQKNADIKVQTTLVKLQGNDYLSTIINREFYGNKYTLVSLYPKHKALLAMNYYKSKTFVLAILVLSLVGIFGVLISNVLTRTLNELKVAAFELSNENFDQPIHVNSTDEIGILAQTFDTMRVNIKDLLQKIRDYNLHLEDMVDQRTQELNEALDLQKTMVDNLDEGFFMFKEGAKLLPVYTAASKEMLPGIDNPENTFVDIVGVDDNEKEGLVEFCDLMLSDTLPFNDVAGLAPQEFINPEGKHIHFSYAPVKDEEGATKIIVVSAKDKTEEIKAMEQARREKEFVDGMITFLQKKKKFFYYISEYKKNREFYTSLESCDMEQMRVFVHTLKGNSGIYHLTELVDYLHNWEEVHKNEPSEKLIPQNEIIALFDDLTSALNKEVSQFEMILDLNDIDAIKQTVEMEISTIEEFKDDYVVPLRNARFSRYFDKEFVFDYVKDIIPDFSAETKRIATDLGKKVYDLEIVGEDVKVPRTFKNIIDNLVHMLRNSLDHAIEKPDVREENGKDPHGSIGIFFKEVSGWLEIRVVDDGAGINFSKIQEIYESKNGPLPDHMQVQDLLFLDGLSSREEASEFSGRGVGMGALKEAIEKRGGSIQIFTTLGEGTTFVLRVPLYEKVVKIDYNNLAA